MTSIYSKEDILKVKNLIDKLIDRTMLLIDSTDPMQQNQSSQNSSFSPPLPDQSTSNPPKINEFIEKISKSPPDPIAQINKSIELLDNSLNDIPNSLNYKPNIPCDDIQSVINQHGAIVFIVNKLVNVMQKVSKIQYFIPEEEKTEDDHISELQIKARDLAKEGLIISNSRKDDLNPNSRLNLIVRATENVIPEFQPDPELNLEYKENRKINYDYTEDYCPYEFEELPPIISPEECQSLHFKEPPPSNTSQSLDFDKPPPSNTGQFLNFDKFDKPSPIIPPPE